jgi:hypothetical protein
MKQTQIWTTKTLSIFGYWLNKKNRITYALLCQLGPQLGLKFHNLIELKWSDVIDKKTLKSKKTIVLENDKIKERDISPYCMRLITFGYMKCSNLYAKAWNDAKYLNQPLDEFKYGMDKDTSSKMIEGHIFINTNGNLITTSTLNRNLNRYYNEFKDEYYKHLGLEFECRDLQSNAFEIAWARDVVKYYNYSKKAFIEVSKFLGHRTLKNTIELLELTPIDDEEYLKFNLFNLSEKEEALLSDMFNSKEWLANFLPKKEIIISTPDNTKHFIQDLE